ncbi:MAG: glycosyltransferase family 2 protein [Lachnospiraceae bacterium]
MNSQKLSIIVPVYNSAGPLEKCIDSILCQTYTEFKLYLVDDNSTDNKTTKVCDAYALRDKRVHVIHHDRNRGLSISREDGFYADNSEWVSFIDNDDLIAPYMYEEMMKFAQNEQVDMICIRGEDKIEEEMETPVWNRDTANTFILAGKDACNKIYANQLDFPLAQPIWGKMMRRGLVEKARLDVLPYRESLYWVFFEDVLFTPMLFYRANTVLFDNRLMYLHRRVYTNLSSSVHPKEFHYESVQAGIEVLRFLERNHLTEAFEKHIVGCFLNMQSIWYKVWKGETDNKRKMQYNQLVDQYYDEYGRKLRNIRMPNIYDKVIRMTILMFEKHRILWGKTIGNIYFKFLCRRTYM